MRLLAAKYSKECQLAKLEIRIVANHSPGMVKFVKVSNKLPTWQPCIYFYYRLTFVLILTYVERARSLAVHVAAEEPAFIAFATQAGMKETLPVEEEGGGA